MASCFSIMSLYHYRLRRTFVAARLHRETHVLDGGETTMHCWAADPEPSGAAADPRPTAVLLHGFGTAAVWQWRHQVGPLSRRLRLVVPDLVFFGGSSTTSHHRSEAFQAECVLKLLDSVGVGRFSVVGTSYGGFVAYRVAAAAGRARVPRVVIASSDLMKTAEDDAALARRAGVGSIPDLMLPRDTGTLRALIRLCVHRKPPFLPEFLLRDALQTLFVDDREERMELLEGIELDNMGEISNSPLPQDVLIVWGEHDSIFPLEKAHLLKKHLGEKARLEVMKDTAHLPQLEDPDRFNEIVLDFLLETPRSSL